MGSPAQPATLGVIPARLASTRMPQKVLRHLAGRPMLEWVWRAASDSGLFRQVLIATDSPQVARLCDASGLPWRMTSPACASGSDRVFEVARELAADIYVNIQGDEPLLQADHFRALLGAIAGPGVRVATLAVPCPAAQAGDPNVVKVAAAPAGRALYFSRAAIPFDRTGTGVRLRKHLGIYAYRAEALAAFAALAPSPLEESEKLEQLRLLENGIDIHVADVELDTIGVDTEEDLQRAERELLRRRGC